MLEGIVLLCVGAAIGFGMDAPQAPSRVTRDLDEGTEARRWRNLEAGRLRDQPWVVEFQLRLDLTLFVFCSLVVRKIRVSTPIARKTNERHHGRKMVADSNDS